MNHVLLLSAWIGVVRAGLVLLRMRAMSNSTRDVVMPPSLSHRRRAVVSGVRLAFLTLLAVLIAFTAGCTTKKKPSPKVAVHRPDAEVQVEELETGAGPKPTPGQVVTVHFEGRLPDGKVFDSSHNRARPLSFVLGKGHVIAGWEEALPVMQVGGRYKVIVPPAAAYGDKPPPGVPKGATLTFDIELLGVRDGEIEERRGGGRRRGGRRGGFGGPRGGGFGSSGF